MSIRIFLIATSLLVASVSFAQEKRVLEIEDDHKVYYQFSKAAPNSPAKGTVLVFNGLIYKMAYWEEYRKGLQREGYNVVQVAYSAHPESIRKLGEEQAPYYTRQVFPLGLPPYQAGTSLQTLAQEAELVLQELDITEAVSVVSLSYGSFPSVEFASSYPDRVKDLVLFAPAVQPSHFYQATLNLLGWNQTFKLGQFNPWIDYNYRLWLRSTLLSRMQAQYESIGESYVPEGLNFDQFFEGVYHLARAGRYADLKDMVGSITEKARVTLILAEYEEDSLREDQEKTWQELQENSYKSLRLVETLSTYHAIPGAHPSLAVGLTVEAIR